MSDKDDNSKNTENLSEDAKKSKFFTPAPGKPLVPPTEKPVTPVKEKPITPPEEKPVTPSSKTKPPIIIIGGKKAEKIKATMNLDLRPISSFTLGDKEYNSKLSEDLPKFCKTLRKSIEEFEDLDDSKIARMLITIGMEYVKHKLKIKD